MTRLALHAVSSEAPAVIRAAGYAGVDHTDLILLRMRDQRSRSDAERVIPFLRREGLRPDRCVRTPDGGVAFYFFGAKPRRFASLECSPFGVAALTSDRDKSQTQAWDVDLQPADLRVTARRIREFLGR
jgi:hypothetical protein